MTNQRQMMNSNRHNLLLLTSTSAALMGGGIAAAQEQPNIVLIYADDLGFGDLSCYGAKRIHTPHSDALASRGVRFENAHACAATSTPSRFGLLTGLYPFRQAGTNIADGDAALIIQPHTLTLPTLLQEYAGYKTAMIGKWHLGIGSVSGEQDWNQHLSPGPNEIGFDYSYIMAATGDRVPCVYLENGYVVGLDPEDPIEVSYKHNFPNEPTGREHPELLYHQRPSPDHGHDQSIVNGISRIGYMRGGRSALWKDEEIADVITEKAVKFIEAQSAEQPFFLFFATNDVHVPRFPHERFRGVTGLGHRGDAVVQFDWCVGEIIRTLEEQGFLENTLIILTSDNGPVLDDGYQDGAAELNQDHHPWGPYRGGKYSAFEAGTRVPFIVSYPGRTPEGITSQALISQVDMMATLASITGISVPVSKEALDTQEQTNAWLGLTPQGRRHIVTSAGTLSIVTPTWKYIAPSKARAYNPRVDIELGNSPEEQLYNLTIDRGEYDNRAKEPEYQGILERMRQILKEETN